MPKTLEEHARAVRGLDNDCVAVINAMHGTAAGRVAREYLDRARAALRKAEHALLLGARVRDANQGAK